MVKKGSATLGSRAPEFGFFKSEFNNGVRVLTESHSHPRAVALGVWILTGTRHEGPGKEGISHLLEHLVFKGTKKRSAFQIAQSLECLGGELNAYTTREYTCYHALVLKEHWKVALDVLCDLVSNMKIKASDFDLEKGVILQEIAMSEDNLDELVFDLYFEKFLIHLRQYNY
jgi:predicted Zn-dependent peptidase